MKICKTCQNELPLSEFYKRSSGTPYTECKSCYLASKKTRNSTRSHIQISEKTCRVCAETKAVSEFHANYSQSGGVGSICKDCAYLANLKTKYKIENIEELIAERNGKCDICGNDFGRRPQIDHDHSCCRSDYTCGKCFRGLLCGNCNLGLGSFGDNTASLSNAVTYVSSYNSMKFKGEV